MVYFDPIWLRWTHSIPYRNQILNSQQHHARIVAHFWTAPVETSQQCESAYSCHTLEEYVLLPNLHFTLVRNLPNALVISCPQVYRNSAQPTAQLSYWRFTFNTPSMLRNILLLENMSLLSYIPSRQKIPNAGWKDPFQETFASFYHSPASLPYSKGKRFTITGNP